MITGWYYKKFSQAKFFGSCFTSQNLLGRFQSEMVSFLLEQNSPSPAEDCEYQFALWMSLFFWAQKPFKILQISFYEASLCFKSCIFAAWQTWMYSCTGHLYHQDKSFCVNSVWVWFSFNVRGEKIRTCLPATCFLVFLKLWQVHC